MRDLCVLFLCVFFICPVTSWAEQNSSETALVGEDKLTEKVTRLEFADGTVKLEVEGRSKPVTLLPSAQQHNPEPTPSESDKERGYLIFVPRQQDGVLPQYRPSKGELINKVQLFASPGEYELATFCIRPLHDLGEVRFKVGAFRNEQGQELSDVGIDKYVMVPTVEQTKLANHECRWVAKWLCPSNVKTAKAMKNMQMVVDVHVPETAQPGKYRCQIELLPENGKTSTVSIELEVLDLELQRSMPWGFFMYNGWTIPKNSAKAKKDLEWCTWRDKELRRTGITQAVISPTSVASPTINEDGSIDFTLYDEAIKRYKEAGFEDPPVLAMERLMLNICAAKGKTEELKFKGQHPGVKAEEIPDELREYAGSVIRKIYDHSLEVNWPPFYVYFADEPTPGSAKMEKAKFMYGLAHEVAPEMRTACTLYTHQWWAPLRDMIDLNIAHYVHPCNNAFANRRWLDLAEAQSADVHGIDWPTAWDYAWETRRMTLTAEKAGLAGMMPWTQWFAQKVDPEKFDPYFFLPTTWRGGPWFLRQADEKIWRSFLWLGVREGIDDSRYLRTARFWIEKSRQSFVPEHQLFAEAAERRVKAIMERVLWVSGSRHEYTTWTMSDADQVRRDLAQVALDLQAALKDE